MMEKVQLLCLPYAGGSAASIYSSWKRKLSSDVEVIPLELPGRGKRIREPLVQSVDEAVDDIMDKNRVRFHEGKPYNLFGHSMGGLLAFELCHKIKEAGFSLPENLFVSAFHPPHVKINKEDHLLPMNEFAEKMVKDGSVPEKILHDKDLYQIFIPVLYMDYRMVFQYRHKLKEPLDCNLHLFTGNRDFSVCHARREWAFYTKGDFKDHIFEGGHFFIRESEQQVLERIESILLSDQILIP